AADSAGERRALVALDLLDECAARPPRVTSGALVHQTRSTCPAGGATDRLDQHRLVCSLGGKPGLPLRLVPQMGRLEFECLYGDGPACHGVARRPGGLDRLRPDSE